MKEIKDHFSNEGIPSLSANQEVLERIGIMLTEHYSRALSQSIKEGIKQTKVRKMEAK